MFIAIKAKSDIPIILIAQNSDFDRIPEAYKRAIGTEQITDVIKISMNLLNKNGN